MNKYHTQLDILLVEDNPADIFLTEAAFEEAGIHANLHVARDGEEAIDFVHRQGSFIGAVRPDLILLDLNLPKKDGFEVLAELKSDARFRQIPIMVLTTSSAQRDIERTYDLHANSYATKPSGLSDYVGFLTSLEHFWRQISRLPDKQTAS